MAIHCTFCDTVINPGETVCSFCGTPVENIPEPVKETAPVPPSAPKLQTVPVEEIPMDAPMDVPSQQETPAPMPEVAPAPAPVASVPVSVSQETPVPASVPEIAPVAPKVNAGKLRFVMKKESAHVCSGCGKVFTDNTKFCGECGGKVEVKETEVKTDTAYKTVAEKSRVCSGCGKVFTDNTKFCGECGGKVEEKETTKEIMVRVREVMQNTCSKCGKVYTDGTKFCGECGGKVEAKISYEETPVQMKEVKKYICTGCGKEFLSATRFCGECGGKIEEKITQEVMENVDIDALKKYAKYHPFEVWEQLIPLADNGNMKALILQYDLSERLLLYQSETAIIKQKIEKAAKQGNPDAVEWIAEGYWAGQHGYNSEEEATAQEWYSRLHAIKERFAEQGDPGAIEWVADQYDSGRLGFVVDEEKAEEWYVKLHPFQEELAKQGDPSAIEWVSDGYWSGLYGYDKDESKARAWYKKIEELAEHGNLYAIEWIADRCGIGDCGYDEDESKAHEWYKKLHVIKEGLAEQKDPDAIEWVVEGYRYGYYGYDEDEGKVRIWHAKLRPFHEKLAEQGDCKSLKWIASGYENGQYGYSQNYEKAIEYYEKAEDLENASSCCNKLGIVFHKQEQYDKALEQYRKAIDANPENAIANANIARCYRNGWGVKKDCQEALKWYGKATENGDYESWQDIGCIYRDGQENVNQDYVQAAKSFLQGVKDCWEENEWPEGFCAEAIGYMYHNGLITSTDASIANKWFTLCTYDDEWNSEKVQKLLEQDGYKKNDDEWIGPDGTVLSMDDIAEGLIEQTAKDLLSCAAPQDSRDKEYMQLFEAIPFFYMNEEIPPNVIQNALKSFAPSLSANEIIGLVDETVFNSGKNGLLVSKRALCAKGNMFQGTKTILLTADSVVTAQNTSLSVNGADLITFITHDDKAAIAQLAEAINMMIKAEY